MPEALIQLKPVQLGGEAIRRRDAVMSFGARSSLALYWLPGHGHEAFWCSDRAGGFELGNFLRLGPDNLALRTARDTAFPSALCFVREAVANGPAPWAVAHPAFVDLVDQELRRSDVEFYARVALERGVVAGLIQIYSAARTFTTWRHRYPRIQAQVEACARGIYALEAAAAGPLSVASQTLWQPPAALSDKAVYRLAALQLAARTPQEAGPEAVRVLKVAMRDVASSELPPEPPQPPPAAGGVQLLRDALAAHDPASQEACVGVARPTTPDGVVWDWAAPLPLLQQPEFGDVVALPQDESEEEESFLL